MLLRFPLFTFVSVAVPSTLGALMLSGCAGLDPLAPTEADAPEPAGARIDYRAATVPRDLADVFDANPSPRQGFRVVGKLTAPAWSWGETELLEGQQLYRTEGYNRRTEKLRFTDAFQSDKYPVRTYLGPVYQQNVDGFNLYYKHACSTGATPCPDPGPTRPEARFVLLHKGPKTAARTCSTDLTPVLLVHGAVQDGSVWMFPGGNDGAGNAFPGTAQKTGLVQSLEAASRCVYAVTFGNFHGDNYSQAINLANAISRVRELHKRADGTQPKVDLVAWSKGVLVVDTYLGNAASWPGKGSRYFDRIADVQRAQVPAYRDDVRAYVALSGPHKGIDMNHRHPIHTLTIASMKSNAGRGPMPWGWFSAMQCVTFGPDWPWYENPYAYSVCSQRGSTWLDYWNRIYISNVTGLDASGKPVSSSSLKALNVAEGVSAAGFDFDEYNISLYGSIDEKGRWVTGFLGQLQATYDLRPDHPVPRRDSSDWKDIDQDEARWYPWVRPKLTYLGGGYLDDPNRIACRKTAYDPAASPCVAWHLAYNSRNAEGSAGFYSKYQLFSGIGIAPTVEMGGHFIERLSSQGLDPRLEALYVLYGDSVGIPGSLYETDGLSCPTCTPNGDGVLLKASIAAVNQLTQGWSASKKTKDAKQEAIALSHLEMGITPAVWDKVLTYLKARD